MFNFESWFEIMWQAYPTDLLHGTKGAKGGPWVSKLRKHVRSEKTACEVLEALRDQCEYSRKLKEQGEAVTKWHFPMCSVWCNQHRWTIELPGIKIDKPMINSKAYQSNIPVLPARTGASRMNDVRGALCQKNSK